MPPSGDTPGAGSPLKVPPHNLAAEQAILGGILINNNALDLVIDMLRAEDFYKEANATLFEAVLGLYDRGEPIDVITLSQHIGQRRLERRVGGTPYLAQLVDAVSTSAGIVHHARIVKGLSVRRKLIDRCSGIVDACFQEWEDTADLLDLAEQAIFDVAQDQVRGGMTSSKEVMDLAFKKLEKAAASSGSVTGVTTGFRDLDAKTSGLQPSELIIIAGRPGMGKTALALNVGYHAARSSGKAVAIFSLEMSKEQLGLRLLGFDAGVDAGRMRSGYLKNEEWGLLTEAADRLSNLPIFIDDRSGISVLEMKAKCRRLMKARELGLVIVDYLQLIQGRGNTESRQSEISEISRMLKAMAKDLVVPVVALSQLNRRVEDRPKKRPELADLRESGAIEQDADVIAFIYRDEVYNPELASSQNVAEITIAKQRNGPTGSFKLTFQKELMAFRDYVAGDAYSAVS